MKVIINFGEKKVVVPCGLDGDISVRELINIATAKYRKLSYDTGSILNSDQVQLRLNNGAVVDPDDRVCDVVDDREELFAIIDFQQTNQPSYTTTINSNGDLSSSVTSSSLSSNLSEHDRLMMPNSTNRHEVIVTDADLRTRSLRVKNDPNSNSQQSISQSSFNSKMTYRKTYSPPTQDAIKIQSSDDITGVHNFYIDETTGDKIFSIVLPKENSPLGIHVVPCNGDEQQVRGLVLQNIEADGRIKRQGILQLNDRIIAINRTNIEQCSFDKAQLIFRTALLEPELELKVVRSMKKPPIPPKPTSFRSNSKTRPTLSEINPNNDLTFIDNDSNMHSLNTRRLGKIIKLSIIKGNDGLGFKLASRDNPTGAANPIYVKTIFPKGAAIDDGRLQRGDRLLTVNSIDVTQMSLPETVGLLRETRIGDKVELVISRQRDGSLPQDLVSDGAPTADIKNEIKPQITTYDIPLNDTSSAGLGITLKGKTSIVDGQSMDMGIFIKSILTGGAASRDNRLRPNDQILVINDSSLINLSNLEAAAILHEAVRREIHPGYIKVTISRLPMTTDDQYTNAARHIKEIDLSPLPSSSIIPVNNDENELDLTTFVPPPLIRKPPTQQSTRHSSRLESTRLADSDLRASSPRSQSSTARSTINPSPSRAKQIFIQPQNEQQATDDVDSGSKNPFDRETPFRQSVSEKRRLTHQPNKQIVQWKQRSFHESRTNNERKQPIRTLPSSSSPNNNNHSSPVLIRSSSFESIHTTNEGHESSSVIHVNDEERKRQAKLRSRACNDSFRQAVDKSYSHSQNVNDDDILNDNKVNKSEKHRFRFSNIFNTKTKRKDLQDETNNSLVIQNQASTTTHEIHPTFYPPPPPAFSSRQDSASSSSSSSANKPTKIHNNDHPSSVFSYPSTSNEQQQQQGYQPYRFDSNQLSSHSQQQVDHIPTMRYESKLMHEYQSKNMPGKSSLSINTQKSVHPPIPRQFLNSNLNGSQSLKQHQPSSHPSILPLQTTQSPYPSTFTVQPAHFTSYSHNMDIPINTSQQQNRRIGYTATPIYPTTRSYFHLENPANV
ncbi:unnamed protein product [Rotaria socialis]|uniref:PDZ domain-containing protein n=1 Tax=Rotaria socialis TaxID=392032 RepID=A0A818EQA7_9BILA|nr:unnamed protein product [Rotaria socialis]CAF3452061.1 unnamed protein product [Rotaria socialis]CAF3463428.1 unnamed protein product [Rotaria socialis]